MEIIKVIIGSTVIGSISGAIIAGIFLMIKTFKDNKYKDAKDNLPVLLEILEDLNMLEQAFVFDGRLCPSIEHRCPDLSPHDGNGLQMSFAQRGHQFRIIGQRIIRNCRKIIFLTPNGCLPYTLEICKKIKFFLAEKESGDSNTRLDFMINILQASLAGYPKEAVIFTQFYTALREYRLQLDNHIEKELPYLSGTINWKMCLFAFLGLAIIILVA